MCWPAWARRRRPRCRHCGRGWTIPCRTYAPRSSTRSGFRQRRCAPVLRSAHDDAERLAADQTVGANNHLVVDDGLARAPTLPVSLLHATESCGVRGVATARTCHLTTITLTPRTL